ncbi:MAG: aspartate-semialdehyde dehydrogenase, partial [bacterium]
MIIKKLRVAVVGATGVVGKEMLSILNERSFPVEKVVPFCSSRSAGSRVDFGNRELVAEELTTESFREHGIELALFSAGAEASRKFAPLAVDAGAVVIDNSSAFRMDPEVPLIVPEVNSRSAESHRGIIANPNCSTIQMAVALKPIQEKAGIKRVVVSTYQSVSGTGKDAMEELWEQVNLITSLRGEDIEPEVYPHQIAFNCLPHIDLFMDDLYTREEHKMVNETRKILEDPSLAVTATAVRVPVFIGHAESVNLELNSELSADDARELLGNYPGIIVLDDQDKDEYPTPVEIAGNDAVFVGRIREDKTLAHGLNLWIVADNLRKGAA